MTDPIPNTIVTIEQIVCDRLKAKLGSSYAVEAFPDNPENYRMVHQRGALLVNYGGADYESDDDSSTTAQRRVMTLDVHVIARQLRGHDSVFTMLEAARLALVGYKARGFDRIAAKRERFVGRKENLWYYAFTIATATWAVELPDDDGLSGPLLERLTMQSPYETSEIPS